MISPIKSDKEKNMATTSKYEVKEYLKKEIMPCIIYFYTNISEFYGNLEGIIDEGIYKRTIKICTRFVAKLINSKMLMYKCWVMVVGSHNFLSSMT